MTYVSITLYYFFVTIKKMKRIDRLEVEIIFCLVIFLFIQSRNNAVLKAGDRTFSRTLGFEAKAKDFKMSPRGRSQGQGRP